MFDIAAREYQIRVSGYDVLIGMVDEDDVAIVDMMEEHHLRILAEGSLHLAVADAVRETQACPLLVLECAAECNLCHCPRLVSSDA